MKTTKAILTAETASPRPLKNDEEERFEPLLPERDAARMLGVSVSRLQRWRCYGGGPRWIRVGGKNGRAVRYRRTDIEAFLNENTIESDPRRQR